jgi:hypothetical protein
VVDEQINRLGGAMAVEAAKVANRDIYEITYDGATGSGRVDATFSNPESGDVSVYTGVDDGSFIVTVAEGYQGEADVSVEKDGQLVDEGTVTFG